LGRLLDGQHPRPVGSAENEAVRGRILKELAALGVPATTQTRMSCYGERRWGALSCGTVTNIIADVFEGSGKKIVLMAHMDSVAAGPGAGDDASGVATILETIRALKARKEQMDVPSAPCSPTERKPACWALPPICVMRRTAPRPAR
jgi:acetylornithine deacetylase/succinyl-diaminopimelate desuccinylase-like protein